LEKARIEVKVQPNASCNQVRGIKDEVWQLRIAAPPVKGKANQELIKFISDILWVSKSSVAIEAGMTSRRKVIGVSGLTQEQVVEQLARYAF